VSISIYCLDNKRPLSDRLQNLLTRAAGLILQEHNLDQGELNIILADNCYLQQLNRQHRGKDKPTDVLSFSMLETDQSAGCEPAAEDDLIVGDIYISLDKAEEQAREAGHPICREILLLAVHGMLHLVGYDHRCRSDFAAMRKREAEFLSLVDPV